MSLVVVFALPGLISLFLWLARPSARVSRGGCGSFAPLPVVFALALEPGPKSVQHPPRLVVPHPQAPSVVRHSRRRRERVHDYSRRGGPRVHVDAREVLRIGIRRDPPEFWTQALGGEVGQVLTAAAGDLEQRPLLGKPGIEGSDQRVPVAFGGREE